jgi:hypothetical protein
MKWLPDMDLNHDKQIQSLLCYRYTIGQTGALNLERMPTESRLEGRARFSRTRTTTRRKAHCRAAHTLLSFDASTM